MSSMVSSQLVFLSELPQHKEADKVRFLGCVNQYNVQTGTLALFHDYPATQRKVLVRVDISLLLETVSNTELQVGAWLNVVGYVTKVNAARPTRPAGQMKGPEVSVQAILLWSAEGLQLDQYERALEIRRQTAITG